MSEQKENSSGRAEAIQQKLDQIKFNKPVKPKFIGITNSEGEQLQKKFERRVIEETDVSEVLSGIIPPEMLLNPYHPLNEIQTHEGPARILRTSRIRQNLTNIIYKVFGFDTATARYSPDTRLITITPRSDAFTTVAAIAQGNFSSVDGPDIAHEALHAKQDINHEQLDTIKSALVIQKSLAIQKTDSDLSLAEAIRLEGRSRDLAILTECQSYVLQYMLSGGSASQDMILDLRSIMQYQPNSSMEKFEVNGLPLSRYLDNGLPPVSDFVIHHVKNYLPKKDQDNPEYIGRINSATLQIVSLLELEVNHSQIAELIRQNYNNIHEGKEWDENLHGYSFLQQAIDERSSESGLNQEALVDSFNEKVENRLSRMRQIALDSITFKQ